MRQAAGSVGTIVMTFIDHKGSTERFWLFLLELEDDDKIILRCRSRKRNTNIIFFEVIPNENDQN